MELCSWDVLIFREEHMVMYGCVGSDLRGDWNSEFIAIILAMFRLLNFASLEC